MAVVVQMGLASLDLNGQGVRHVPLATANLVMVHHNSPGPVLRALEGRTSDRARQPTAAVEDRKVLVALADRQPHRS